MAHRKSIRARTADNQIYELRARPLRWVACSALAAKIAAPAKRDALLAGSRAASGKCASRKYESRFRLYTAAGALLVNPTLAAIAGIMKNTTKLFLSIGLMTSGAIWSQPLEKQYFKRHTIEIAGSVSFQFSSLTYISDRGPGTYGSTSQKTNRFDLDFSPRISYYFIDYWFGYLSPVLTISHSKSDIRPLYPDTPDNATTYDGGTQINFRPIVGLGRTLRLNEALFVSISLDVQGRHYTVYSRIQFDPETYTYAGLTKFSLRFTPKLRLSDNTFFNIGINFHYETDRLLVSWFQQRKFGEYIDHFGSGLDLGFSWIF